MMQLVSYYTGFDNTLVEAAKYGLEKFNEYCKTNLVRLMKRIDCKLSTRRKVSLSAYKRMSLAPQESLSISAQQRSYIIEK